MASHNYIIGFLKYYQHPVNNGTYPYSNKTQESTKNSILEGNDLDLKSREAIKRTQ